jgi:hypothetical protein
MTNKKPKSPEKEKKKIKTESEQKKEFLIEQLLNVLNIEADFQKSIKKLLALELDDILEAEQFNSIMIYCSKNMMKYLIKQHKELKNFYSNFNESELADLILFYNTETGKKLLSKSIDLLQITNNILLEALDDKKLNALIDGFVSVITFTEDDNKSDDDSNDSDDE